MGPRVVAAGAEEGHRRPLHPLHLAVEAGAAEVVVVAEVEEAEAGPYWVGEEEAGA